MKRTQIMIIFVVAFFGAVFAQNLTTVTEPVTSTATSSFTGVTETTANNVTNTTTPVEPTTAAKFTGSTAAPPFIDTTTSGPTVAPTSTHPAVITTEYDNGTTVVSTTPVVTTMTSGPCVPSGFDGASFIGGIVLALGVIVILVIIVKCYNHQSRKNELHYSQF